MQSTDQLLERLRRKSAYPDSTVDITVTNASVIEEWCQSGVKFSASGSRLEQTWESAVGGLMKCIVPTAGQGPILHEGGVYLGCWLESTGTINAERLDRFIPSVAKTTFQLFSTFQRDDGLMPYKITPQGPVFKQIQLVTPLARCVWNHYGLNGRDRTFLHTMYDAMSRYDTWLSTVRNTRRTGCVEAFCTFDTGHDLSPRFWHLPDTPYLNNPALYDPNSPILPLLAPDLTANVYCQRTYLAKIADEIGESRDEWTSKASQTLEALYRYCYHEGDQFFYDRDRNDQFVRIQSDVLLRVLACEVGDDDFFATALQRYLLNTSKFFAKYPLTSIAMDDPRFDPSSSYNTWAGTTNFLSLIRAAHAFEYHGRHVELSWVIQATMNALYRMTRFGQTINPWTGEEGYTEMYSPAILCVLDYVERLCGILPTPQGDLWFTGLVPDPRDHGEEIAEQTAYARTIDGVEFELVNTRQSCTIFRNHQVWIRFPHGTRVITDRAGNLKAIVGMSIRTIAGDLAYHGTEIPVTVSGNQEWLLEGGHLRLVNNPGMTMPTYR